MPMASEWVMRNDYLDKLKAFEGKDLIKVVTGLRRCGKSTLLMLYRSELLKQGVPEDHILLFNFELMELDEIRDYKVFYHFVKDRLPENGRTWLLLDEIQQVAQWERAVNSLRIEADVDICVTGSNAHLLSSEIATLLSGRYVEIKMLPLSFREYISFHHLPDSWTNEERFNQYLRFGGLPAVTALPQDESIIQDFLQGVFNTVIVKDIVDRSKLRDVTLLNRILRYVIGNTGSIVSANRISGFLSSQDKGESIRPASVSATLDVLEQAYVLYQVQRYDIRGKETLKTLSKYYVVDTGFRNILIGHTDRDFGHVLETVVFFELLRRGYQVFIGKWFDKEVDFLAIRQDDKRYYQVTASVLDEGVRTRELAPLVAIQDNYVKIILSMDTTWFTDHEGIRFQNIIEFLLEDDYEKSKPILEQTET